MDTKPALVVPNTSRCDGCLETFSNPLVNEFSVQTILGGRKTFFFCPSCAQKKGTQGEKKGPKIPDPR
jgi:hypothetical protein